MGEQRPVIAEVVVVVVDDVAGDDEADDEVEKDSLSFNSPEGVLTCSSLAAARDSASKGFALANISEEEVSKLPTKSVEEDSFGQLRLFS